MNKIKVNECELPIDVLKTGVEVDLSGQNLRVEDAIIIAACINVSSSMTSVDLSSNHLTRGAEKSSEGALLVRCVGGGEIRFETDITGIKAIADALSVSSSMNSLK